MTTLDYVVVVVFLGAVGFLGVALARRAGKNTDEFILAGRNLPWWLAGTSMLAGSFGPDSPLHQSRKIRQTGLVGAWFYWAQITPMVVHSLVFSRLWRRTGITTPVEFYDIRYGGKAKVGARIFAVGYAAVVEQTALVALSLLGLIKISDVLFDLPEAFVLVGLAVPSDVAVVLTAVVLAMAYSAASGVYGVVWTDFVEFIVALGCAYLLTLIVYADAGWASGLQDRLAAAGSETGATVRDMVPVFGFWMLVYLFVQPFVTSSGNTALNQRILAIRDEREAMFSGVWRVFTHYVIRGWPWYMAGLVSLVLLPDLVADSEMAYPTLIREYMPAGLRGLMVAGFFAAFMSSVDTGIHTSSSIFLNDFYRPYVRPDATEKHYVAVSRVAIVVFAALAVTVALLSDSILDLLMILMKINGGVGLVLVLRWFWWRVNVWADLAAHAAVVPIVLLIENDAAVFGRLGYGAGPTGWVMGSLGLDGLDNTYAVQFVLITAAVAAVWLTVMALTRPESDETLVAFYRRVRPYGFWGPIREKAGVEPADRPADDLKRVGLGLAFCYSALFSVGGLFLAEWGVAAVAGAVAGVSVTFLLRSIAQAPLDLSDRGTPDGGDGLAVGAVAVAGAPAQT